MKSTTVLGWILILLTAISAWYYDSITENSVLFIDDLISQKSRDFLLCNPKKILFSILIIQIAIYCRQQYLMQKDENIKVFNNICKSIFVSHISNDPEIDNNKIRVTLFKRHIGYKFSWCWTLSNKYLYLKQVGRYQSIQDKKNCNLKFLANEGCVGICFNTGQVIHQEIKEFKIANPTLYYKNTNEVFNLNLDKAQKINVKSCSFLAFPVKYFNTGDVFGVIIFDSTEKEKTKKLKTRELEDQISNYSAFFIDKSV